MCESPSAAQFHQYHVVGPALPTPGDEHPKIYRIKLWATNECVTVNADVWFVRVFARRYFLRKLKKVKKSNGRMLAINEVPLVVRVNLDV
ncbi:hypothetical protein GUJ93_ZPchr0005g15337 [Zizania palustris]|uniref:Ribosomal protein 50S-L18Ae/60S-L20/60S-L18A domain-containing protein n=1 Tax=Zizania palustris TaxID=103762 RepID=A0A8J5SHV0_ZIZPA|nr:hypothetical protein GUJ93_ZPchr0005g15337 [Zizania palustris]